MNESKQTEHKTKSKQNQKPKIKNQKELINQTKSQQTKSTKTKSNKIKQRKQKRKETGKTNQKTNGK